MNTEYLVITLCSNQLVSINKFVKEYDNAGSNVATPLGNSFILRENEFKSLVDAVEGNSLVIVYGAPGVGKTKLVIEGLKELLKIDSSYKASCLSYKNHSLINDLYQYIDEGKDYYLFVDDANRVYEFQQVTSLKKGHSF